MYKYLLLHIPSGNFLHSSEYRDIDGYVQLRGSWNGMMKAKRIYFFWDIPETAERHAFTSRSRAKEWLRRHCHLVNKTQFEIIEIIE